MAQRQGLVQIYTGDGKGKTTAALGLAMRAVGRGMKVRIFQFMKPRQSSGEHFSSTGFGDRLIIEPIGRASWVHRNDDRDEDARLAGEGLARARQAMCGGRADLIVLDEIDVAVYFGLLDLDSVLRFIDQRPESVELVLTGRRAAPEIIDRADLVTEMKLIRHPYEAGITAREGIEY